MRHDIIVPRDVPAQPWKNGEGLRRVLLHTPHWRISVADISGEAVFSSLPGWDRLLIPLEGGELSLRIGRESHHVDLEHPVRFRGEDEVNCAKPQRPIRVVNVMTDRAAASLRCAVTDGQPDSDEPASAAVLLSGWARAGRRLVFPGTVFRGGSTPVFPEDARVAQLHLTHRPIQETAIP